MADEPVEGSSQFDKGPLGPQWNQSSGSEGPSGTPQNPSVTDPHSKAQFIGGDPELKAQNSPPPGWEQENAARSNFMGAHGLNPTRNPQTSGTRPTVRKPQLRPGQVGHTNIGGSSITGTGMGMQAKVPQEVPQPHAEGTGQPQLENAQAQQQHHQGMLKRTVGRLMNPGPNGEAPLVEQAFQLHYRSKLLARPGGWKEAIRGSYGKEPIAWENPMKAASVGEGGVSVRDAMTQQVLRNQQQRRQ